MMIRVNGAAAASAPTITIAAGTSPVTEGTAATFTVTASEAPSANLAVNLSVAEKAGSDFVAPGNEGSKTVTINSGDTTATFSVATVDDTIEEPNGSVTVTVAAGTGYTVGSTASATVMVNDNDEPANSAPTVANEIPNQSATAGTAFSFQFAANAFNDTDTGDTLIYTATKGDDSELPDWLTFTASSRTFSGTPPAAAVGTLSVKVTASDDTDSVSDTFDIVVAADTAPDFGTETVANQSYTQNTAISNLTLPAATSGNGDLSYALTPALPAGLAFTASTRTISGTPTATQAATTYTYKVTDADSNTADSDADTLTFTIAVTYGCAGSTAVGGSTVTSGGLVDDCETLLASEATLVGAGTALNWDTGTAMASWNGVTVSGSRVTQLELSGRSLSGSIPAELGDLENLTVLSIGDNSLSGSIPAELGDLSNLTRLTLSINSLTGSIPKELGNLSNLTSLALRENSLTGSIPVELGDLSNLTLLDLRSNSLTGSIPKVLGDLTNLSLGLFLDSNSLTGCIPVAIRRWQGDINPQKNNVNLPVCPGVPVLTLASGDTEIAASWTAPEGGTPTGYDLNYKLSTATGWSNASHTGTGTSATIKSLTNGSEYNVRVRAKVDSHIGDWSETRNSTPTDGAPAFSSASVNGVKLTITFNEALAAAANLANSAFAVKKTPSGDTETDVDLHATTQPSISGSTVVLTLATAVVATDGSVKVSYTKPATGTDNTIEDANGNETDSFSEQDVTNDTAAIPTITIEAGTSPITEGTAAMFTVTASPAPSANLTVNLSVADVSGSDFVATANEGSQTVTLTADSTSVTYSVATVGDTTDEDSGDVTVTVASGTGYTVGSTASATVTVNDDDAPPDTVAPDFGTATVANQDYVAGTMITNLTLPAATGGDGALSYALTPALPAGLTFTASTRTISGTPTAGQAATTYTYTVTDADTNTEASDTDTLTFTIAVTYVCAGSTAVGGSTVTSGGLVDDCETLLASEATLVGAGTALNWDTGTAMASWNGVTVSGSRVTQLELTSRSLSGSIPAELGDLSNLTRLTLSINSLTGSIPKELGNLSNLTSLAMFSNSLTGSIPVELGDLSNLTLLNLSDNSLTGSIPKELGNLTNLTIGILLDGNSLTGCIPVAIRRYQDGINPQKNNVNLPVCPGVPVLTLTPGDAEIAASWTAPEGGTPTGYDLNYKLSTATGWSAASHTGTGTSATIKSLTNGSQYNVRVRAKTDTDTGDWSETRNATPTDGAPAFSSASVNGDKLTITFNEALAAAANLSNDAFAVKKTPSGGTETDVSLSTTTQPSISGSTVVLTLATAVVATDGSVKVSYTKPTSGTDNTIEDANGNETDSFSEQDVTNDTGTGPTITIEADTLSITEGTTATFTVTASPAPSANLTVNLTVADDADSDFVASTDEGNKTVMINSGDTSATYSVATVGDSTEEENGDVKVTVAAGTGYTVGSTASATVTVNDDDGANAAPVFTSQPTTATVPENSDDDTAVMTTDATPVALTITATDADGDDITYTLDTEAAKLFAIDSDGAITVDLDDGLALDHEGSGGSITVTVTAGDGTDTADHEVTITIADEDDEAPDTPAMPTVAGASSTSVTVTWTAPTNTGPAINDYDVQYKLSTVTDWTDHSFTGATTTTTISGLSPSTTYDVQVMAKSPEGSSDWSATGSGATNANAAPVFTSQPTTATVPENSDDDTAVMTTDATPVALTITATDADGDDITYTLDTEAVKLFAIGTDGAITVEVDSRSALDHEGSGGSITVTVTADDGTDTTDHEVTVTIADEEEPPDAPAQPTVAAASSTSVTVSWTAPTNTGKPAINDYDVRYKVSTATGWTDHSFTGTGISTTISGLTPSTTYNVQVRAANAEGAVNWSPTGSGATSANIAPVFTSQPTTATVDENSDDNTAVQTGDPAADLTVTATDANAADTITYTLDTEAAKLFDIDADGAITVDVDSDSALDHEGLGGSITVTVTATDDHGATDTHNVTITVTDEIEPPSAPDAPTVAGASTSSLRVNWTAPANTGPPINDYDVQYRFSSHSSDNPWIDHSFTGAGTTTTINVPDASRSYHVQVMATNAEGSSDWSATGSGSTNDLTITIAAGTTPVTEGTAATFTVTSSPAPHRDLEVTLRVQEAAGSDFVASSDEGLLDVTIAQGDTTATYSVPTQDDSIDEPNGSITVQLGDTIYYELGSTTIATVAVNDNDDPPTNPPVFRDQPTTATVPENSADGTAVQTGDPPVALTVTAEDEDGDTLTYSLDSTSDAVFEIDSSSGAITVQVEEGSALDHESLEDGSISVTVTATDGTGTASHVVTVTVADELEPPDAPDAPTVTSASATSVTVTWTAPDNAGKPDIDDYNVRYRVSGATAWIDHSFTGAEVTTTIAGLTASTTYEVQVQASNDEGDSDWSATGSGATGAADNNAPTFTSPPASLEVAEDSAGGTIVGTVAATDADGDTLSYSLDSTSGAAFDIDASGVITVESGGALDYEDTPSYAAVVTVNDGTVDVTHSLTINVTDAVEPPDAPAAPTVTGLSPNSVSVSWTAPDTADRPDITDYDVRYKLSTETDWTDHDFIGTGIATAIADLTPEATYDVQVQAFNADGASGWSESGSGATSVNNVPVFTDQAATASVAENSDDGTEVVTITATDEDTGDTITYSLDGDSDALFDIDPFTGAITVQVESGSALDHEATPSVTATVTATDSNDGTATHEVTVSVTDELEPPDAPAAPAVTGASQTSVTVSWIAPDNTGRPDITGYDVRYRASGADDWTDHDVTGTGTTATITDLSVGTAYEAQVQAVNDEGSSGWSGTGSGATDSPDNRAPVFTDQATTASVVENSAGGTPVVTITATDADGDTIAYSLDAASDAVFDISASGAITVQAGATLDHEATPSYPAVVTAGDGTVDVTHSLTISVTDEDEPPDAPAAPTVTGASSTSLTVNWTAPDNTGRPDISDYDVRYKLSTATEWTDHDFTGTGTRTTISGLTVGATYEVQVKAHNEEDESGWSGTGSGATSTTITPAPVVEESMVSGSTVTLEFDNELDTTSVPEPEDFTVTVSGSSAASAVASRTSGGAPAPLPAQEEHRVTAVSIRGSVLELTISPPVRADQTVTVSYTPGDRPLRTEDGDEVADFTITPANETTDVQPPVNQAPSADAGADATASAGASVSLDGSASSDPEGDALTYAWTQTAGASVTLTGANTAEASFTAPAEPGALTFRLTVTDPGGLVGVDTVTVTVSDGAPDFGGASVAALSLDQGQALDPQVLPAASGGNGALTYSLTSSPAGLAGLAFDPATRTLSGTAGAAGSYTFTYRAEDADGNRQDSDAASLTFRVTVSAGEDRKRVLTHALAGMGQQLLSNALDNIGARFDEPADTNNITVGGQSLASLGLFGDGRGGFRGRGYGGNRLTWSHPAGSAGMNGGLGQARAYGGSSNGAYGSGSGGGYGSGMDRAYGSSPNGTYGGGSGSPYGGDPNGAYGNSPGSALGSGSSGTFGSAPNAPYGGGMNGGYGGGMNGAFDAGSDGACSAVELDPQAFAGGGAPSCGLTSRSIALGGSPDQLLQASAFSWGLGVAANGKPQGPRWSVWGRGDLGMFQGRPDAGSGYDGDMRTGWLGVDARTGPWVAGVALSRSTGDADYHAGGGAGSAQRGRLEIELTALYPYLRWAFGNGIELQALMGAGTGDARHFAGRDAPEDADLKMRLGSLGVRGPMAVLAGLNINARADLGFVRMETGDGEGAVHGLTADAWRARFGFEASRQIELAPLCELVPFIEVAGRQDSGDGLEGAGVEVAGGVRFRNGRFQLEARGRVLALHSADGAKERGVSLTAQLAPRADGGGLTLSLTPRWGASASPTEALWRHEMPHLASHAGAETAVLGAQAGYGFVLPSGLLTSFTEADLAGEDHRVLRAGVRYEAAGTRLQTEFLIERHESLNAPTDHGLRLNLGIGF